MAYGLGYALIDGALGAAAGAGQGIADQALIEQKQQMEILRDQRLSQLRQQEHAADTKGDIAARQANIDQQTERSAKFFQSNKLPSTPITDQATATYDDPNNPGQTASVASNPVTAQEAPSDRAQAAEYARKALETGNPNIIGAAEGYQKNVLSAQDMDRKNALEQSKVGLEASRTPYYQALANKYQAEADALAQGGKAIPGPMVQWKQDDDGHNIMVDTHSGAIGRIVPGQAAVPAQTHLFSADEPGKPAVPMHEEWTLGGKPIDGGLRSIYPAFFARLDRPSQKPGIVDSARAGAVPAEDSSTYDDAGTALDMANGEPGSTTTATTTPTQSGPAPRTAPRAGAIINGYRFKGGDPNDKKSWEKA